jgi:hypothetical protein
MANERESRTAKLQRTETITAEAFRRLPMLIARGVVIEVTGLSSDEISDMILAGRLRVFRSRTGGRAKFYRHEVGRMVGIE